MNFKNIFKKNQIIIYALALMLVSAGYLNYTNNMENKEVETSTQDVERWAVVENEEAKASNSNIEKETKLKDEETALVPNEVADIGDATLVNSNDVVQDEYFAKSKIEREAMYSQMQETYQTILNSPNSAEAQKEMASVEMAKINETKKCIMICENLLETKGFKNCVIFVNEGSVSVIVGAKELKPDQTAQIQNIISRELGAIVENIHISVK